MLCEKILGNLSQDNYDNTDIETVDVKWHDVRMRLHRCVSSTGEEIGIRLSGEELTRGLHHGDIIYKDEKRVVAVNIPCCDTLRLVVSHDMPYAMAQMCYEIGNTHAKLMRGEDEYTYYMAYNSYYVYLLEKLKSVKGIHTEIIKRRLNIDDNIAISLN